ncbi:MAG: NAD(P)H-dependent oxidoreductase [Clostridia bacterium]|nr:NAD(P)H-dependent oxidoreductase [Clostridia bacterium]
MILYIDGAVREKSRTRELADYLVSKFPDNTEIEYVRLNEENILPLNDKTLFMREELCRSGDFNNDYFKYAKQFARADEIIFVSPYWDLSFPSVIKTYLENICVVGLTFSYSDKGIPVSMCKAKRLYYVTTAGGIITDDSFGYGYVKTLLQKMFGVKESFLIKAENLDVFGSDQNKIMSDTKRKIDALLAENNI